MELKLHQRKGDKSNTQIYIKAIYFFIDELLPKYKKDRLKLKIFLKKFVGSYKNTFGLIQQISKNKYTIEINKNKAFHEIITTLAHELMHVKQGIYGKLVLVNDGFKWNGKLYKSVDLLDIDAYSNCKWELEALKFEKIATEKFFKSFLVEELKNLWADS